MTTQNQLTNLIQNANAPKSAREDLLLSIERDTAEIASVVTSLGALVDRHDWSGIQQIFADRVTLDYSSLFGGEAEALSPKDITDRWSALVPGFDRTQHGIVIQDISLEGHEATVLSFVSAVHALANPGLEDLWYVDGYYHHKLRKTNSGWKITDMRLEGRREFGSRALIELALSRVAKRTQVHNSENVLSVPVNFRSDKATLAGRLFYPLDFLPGKSYPAVVLSGSWTSVKEQNPSEYARRLAAQGFLALAFDHTGFGQSEGTVRQVENPDAKVADIKHAVTYLLDLDAVDASRIYGLGICAGGGYMAVATAQDARISKLATVAGWYTDEHLYQSFFGEGFASLQATGKEARAHFEKTGSVQYIRAIDGTGEQAAAMVGRDVVSYYGDRTKDNGNWQNQWALMSYDYIFNFATLPYTKSIQVPTLVVHSDQAISAGAARDHFEMLTTAKKLVWLDNANQFDFYDQPSVVNRVSQEVATWFQANPSL